jgi:hypothetical protein
MRGRAEEARRAHNPEVVGSNPTPATMIDKPMTTRGHRLWFAGVAQLVEQGTHKPLVTGSSPVAGISSQPRWFALGAACFDRLNPAPLVRSQDKEVEFRPIAPDAFA